MGVYTMKKLKCMLETSYSIDAIFYLRKSSILVSLVFLIILSIMQMTPTAFVLIGDAPYRWDLNVWDISESSQHLLEDNLPDDCVVNNYKLSCKQSLDIVLQNEVRVAFNLPTSTVRNGLIFNEDHFLFVIDDMNYKFDYSKFEGVDFSNITYDEMFMRVASTIKPMFMPAMLLETYQSGILLTFGFVLIVSVLFMLLRIGRQVFLSYKEVLNLVIYSSTFPAIMALVIGMFNGAWSIIIYNIGTLIVLFFVYRSRVEPYLSGQRAG